MRTIALALFVVLPSLTGCSQWLSAPGGVRMWAAPESAILLPDSPPELENEVFSSTARSIRLEAAVNELVSFQLAFRGESGTPGVAEIELADLVQQDRKIPSAGNVRMYRQGRLWVEDYPNWYLRLTPNLREPRAIPDILIPLSAPRGGLPLQVGIGQCEAVWVDLRVPPGTEPGIYRSTVQARYHSGASQSFELVLTVHPFSLPLTQHLPVIAGVDAGKVLRQHLEVDGRPYAPNRLSADDPLYDDAVKILDKTIALLHEHRCSAMLTDLQPLRKLDSRGRLQLDWADYDRLVSGVLSGGAFEDRIPALAWPMPVSDRDPNPDLHGGWGSAQYADMLVEYLRQCVEHFDQRGWLDRHFVWMPLPPSNQASGYSQFAWLGSTIRRADTRLALVCDLAPQPMKAFGSADDRYQDIGSLVSIWAPPAGVADTEVLSKARGAGHRTWLQPARPPYSGSLSFIAPAVHARSLAWQGYRSGCQAMFLPETTSWQEDGTSTAANSAGVLLWPGKPYGLDAPVPSIRLKRLLRGVQDYEYLWLLRQNQRPAVAELIAADLFAFAGTGAYGEHYLDSRPNGWVHDPAAWLLARSLMARELSVAVELAANPASAAGPAEQAPHEFAHKLEWRRHVEGVRRVHTSVEGIRVRLDRQRRENPISVKATVSIFNATRDPYSARLAMPDLPADWQVGPEPAPIENLQPTRTVFREIEVFTAGIPSNVEGLLPLTFKSIPAEGEPLDLPGRVCALTAQRLAAPVVDGKLDDWPLATNNAAGDFVLVGAMDVPKLHASSPDRPSQKTLAFAGRDDDYLYLAFNCSDDHMAERIITKGNQVRYDDLWPASEDLLEVVLDPSGQAVVPGDLLHIVVKANGAVVTERGAPCLTGIGGHGDWPGDVIAVVHDDYPDRWTAEIRIALESLGKLAPVWGINFARYHARLGEYSTWSAARRYFYSPVSLGNIYLGQ